MVLSRYPQVDDERIVVFFDGTDAVWGGCNDFVERYLRLERATGGQYVQYASFAHALCMCCSCDAPALQLRCICAASALQVPASSCPRRCTAAAPRPPLRAAPVRPTRGPGSLGR